MERKAKPGKAIAVGFIQRIKNHQHQPALATLRCTFTTSIENVAEAKPV